MKKVLLLAFAIMCQHAFAQMVQVAPPPNATIPEHLSNFSSSGTTNTDYMSMWALPSVGSTSANTRCPGNTYRYQRTEYLITAAEMAASGFPVGYEINSIGFLISTAGVGAQSGQFTVYLKNTSDATYTIGSNWDITGFTKVSDIANWTVPIAVGSYEVPFSGGSAFTYTGGGVYVAWEFNNPAGTLGTTALIGYCNTNLANSLYGNRSNTAVPTALAVSAFRPATIFGNNFYTDIAAITNIYTSERTPMPYNVPTPIGVRVANTSTSAATFDVTLTVKDASNTTTRYTATQTVTALAAGTATILNFTGWTPTSAEDVKITAATSTIAGENWLSNNSLTINGSANTDTYSYNYSTTGASGFGFTYPGTGIFLSKFHMTGTGKLNGANLVIANYASNPGNSIQAIALNSSGTIIGQSAAYTIAAGDLGVNKSFTFTTPPVLTNEDFYVGLLQTAGTAQYYPMGTFGESPMRDNVFYTSNTDGTGLAVLPTTFNLRYGIEAVVGPNFTPPVVTTTAATVTNAVSATVNGTINASGNTVTSSFEYGLTTSYGTTVSGTPASVTGSTTTAISSALTGLSPSTTYHYRAKGNVGAFVFFGADMTFTTPAAVLPTVVTNAATLIATTGATLNGTINASGYNTTAKFEYGLTTAYGSTVTVAAPVTGSTNTNVSFAISGLSPNTLYHFRAVGTNVAGTVNGSDLTFTTVALPPTVVTTAASLIGDYTATLNGTVNPNGPTATVTFEYGLTTAYGTTVNATPNTVTGTTTTNVSAAISGLSISTQYHYRVKAVNSGGTSLGNDMMFMTSCNMPATPGTITGPASICQGATATYSITAIPTATSYNWTLPTGASITSGSGTNSISVSYSTSAVSGNITVAAVNLCGVGNAATLPVTVNALPTPSLVSGLLSVCEGTTGVVYQTQAGMTGYTWSVSTGGAITAGAGTNTVTVTWATAGSRTISVNYTNAAGCTPAAATVFNVTVNPRPTPTITGSATACTGFNNNVYSTQAGMTGYTWTISAGGSIVSGAGTNAITVQWTTTGSKTVTVNYASSSGCLALAPASLAVTVNPVPAPTLTGPISLCEGSAGAVYTTDAGYSDYVWNISYGGVITSGAGSNQITVNWANAGARTISVNYSNAFGCQALAATVLNITIKPAPIPTVAGPADACEGSNTNTFTTEELQSGYTWAVSPGGTILSGAGTNSITVKWNASGNQWVSASYVNSYGCAAVTPTVFNVNVNPLPAAAGAVAGSNTVCAGAVDVTYTTAPINLATSYTWTLPTGATITQGAGTRTIKVSFANNASSGIVKVSGTNDCGSGASSPNFNVTVNPLPVTPVVTVHHDTLVSSALTGNQWYFNGAIIPGATSKTYVPTQHGSYYVVVTANGCSSAQSNTIAFTDLQNGANSQSSVSVYPNPNSGRFSVDVILSKPAIVNISVHNSIGSMVWKRDNVSIDNTLLVPVEISDLPAGVYVVSVRNNDLAISRKIVVQK